MDDTFVCSRAATYGSGEASQYFRIAFSEDGCTMRVLRASVRLFHSPCFFKDTAFRVASDQLAGHVQQFEDVLIGNPVVDAYAVPFRNQNFPIDQYLHVARKVGLFQIQIGSDFTTAGMAASNRLEDADAVGVRQGIQQPGAKLGGDNGHDLKWCVTG